MSGHPFRRLGVVGGVALAFAGSAFAYVCHPDLPGTRSLTIHGRVDGYRMTGSHVAIDVWTNGCQRRISWNPLARTSSRGRCTSGGGTGGTARRTATDGRFRVVLTAGSTIPDLPDRLAVYDARTGASLHNWPLPTRAFSVDVARGVAVLSTANGVYAVRLSDGQFALVGVKRRGDRPQIEAPGIAFQDDLYKRTDGRSVMKFLPFRTVSRTLRSFGPLRVPATIGDFSVDGRNVIFVKKDPTGRCDRIGLWSIPWHYTTDLMDEPPICPEKHAAGGITALAIGGQYVEVVTTYGNVQTLISSTIVHCIELVVTRAQLGVAAIRTIAGDGAMMAYAVGPQDRPGRIGLLAGQRQVRVVESTSVAVQLSADRHQLAVLRADGRIDVLQDERVLRTFEPSGARAAALRAGELTVLTRGRTLDVYSVDDGRLLHSWAVPAHTNPAVDVHFGVAVLTAGGKVLAIRLATGRSRVLLAAPRPVWAHLDDVGVVYRYNAGRSGFLGFISFAAVEQKLR